MDGEGRGGAETERKWVGYGLERAKVVTETWGMERLGKGMGSIHPTWRAGCSYEYRCRCRSTTASHSVTAAIKNGTPGIGITSSSLTAMCAVESSDLVNFLHLFFFISRSETLSSRKDEFAPVTDVVTPSSRCLSSISPGISPRAAAPMLNLCISRHISSQWFCPAANGFSGLVVHKNSSD